MVITGLAYKAKLEEVVDRHRKLWTRQMPGGILARIDPEELPFIDPLSRCPDSVSMAEAWDHNYYVRRYVNDDLLPVARVSFGSSTFGGFLGAKVTMIDGIGWSIPLLNNYEELQQLRYEENNVWIQRQQKACLDFLKTARGKFGLCETEPMDGLNLVEVLRGNAVYTDIYDHPHELHQLLEFACQFNIRFIEMQRSLLAPCLLFQEGIFSMFRIWLPGTPVWISVDAYGLCSPTVFREFGLSYTQRVVDHFGSGWVHLHSSALHLLPEIVKIKGLTGIGIYDDPNTRRGFEELPKIRAITGDTPLQIDCLVDELEKGLRHGSLPGGIMLMIKKGVRTVDQANRLMDKVRAYQVSH
jgi:hypothetical protein